MNLFKKAASALVLSLALATATVVPVSAVPTCTVTVDQSGTTVTGTANADVVCLNGSNLVANLLGGNDTVINNGSNNTIDLGAGDDTVDASGGNGAIIVGGTGNDTITGTPGIDTISGGIGADNLTGSAGDDNISGEADNDILDGGDGSDTLNGGDGDDALVGGASGDVMNGGPGTDNLAGNAGDDSIFGESGTDTLAGNENDDILVGGENLDSVDGGAGLNVCDYESGETLASSCSYDESAPTISSISVTSTNFDSTSSPVDLSLSMNILDEVGFKRSQVDCTVQADGYTYSAISIEILPSGATTKTAASTRTSFSISGPATNRTVAVGVRAHQGMKPGLYSCRVLLEDVLNHSRTVSGATTFTVTRSAGSFDDAPPVISGFSSTPNPVDVSSAGQSVTTTFEADDPSGPNVGYIRCSLYDGGWFNLVDFAWYDRSRLINYNQGSSVTTLESSATHVKFQSVFTIPAGTHPGVYSCGISRVTDGLGNTTFGGSVGTITVVNTATLDTSGPTVTTSMSAMQTVDVGAAARNLNLTFSAQDSSGWDWGYFACVLSGSTKILDTVIESQFLRVSDYGGRTLISSVTGTSTNREIAVGFQIPLGAIPGLYRCTLNSRDVLDNSSSVLVTTIKVMRTPAGMPGAVTDLTFTPDTSRPTEGSLTWTAPTDLGSPVLTDYILESSLDGTTWTTIADGTNTNRVASLTNLRVNTDYQFRVRAENGATSGQNLTWITLNWSNVATVRTGAAVVPLAPTALNVTSVTVSSVATSWVASAYTGGSAITEFVVETLRDGSSSWQRVPTTNPTSLSLAVSGLAPGTRYEIRVSAVNSVGASPYLSGEFTTSTSAPGVPVMSAVSSLTANSVTLNWNLPSTNGGDAITDYKVEFSSNGGTSWSEIAHDASAVRNFAVTGLSSATAYQFRVSTINSLGTSAPSTPVSVTTPNGAPSSISALRTGSLTANSATLRWNAPANNGGVALTDYVVRISRDGGITWRVIAHRASTTNAFSVIGMAPGTDYLIQVSAKNSLGTGPSSTLSITTQTTLASKPLNLTSRTVTSTTLSLRWGLPATNGGSALTDYKIEVSSNLGSSWTEIPHSASLTRSFDVSGLTRATTYQFRVSAISSVGVGAVSDIVTVKTLSAVPNAPTPFSTSVGTKTASLKWAAPVDNGGQVITDYVVSISRDSGTSWAVLESAVSIKRTFAITGLTPGATYPVRIQAKNRIGNSAPLELTITTLPVVASAPLNLSTSEVTGSTLRLNWAAPTNDGGARVSNYLIQVSSVGSKFTTIEHPVSDALDLLLGGLNAGTKYWFKVAAINAAGNSAFSNTIEALTVGVAPSAPTALAGTASATNVLLSWQSTPVAGGSAIRNYIVEYSSDEGSTWLVVTKPFSTALRFRVTGLTSSTSYKFRVKAVNDVGSSEASAELSVTTA